MRGGYTGIPVFKVRLGNSAGGERKGISGEGKSIAFLRTQTKRGTRKIPGARGATTADAVFVKSNSGY